MLRFLTISHLQILTAEYITKGIVKTDQYLTQ